MGYVYTVSNVLGTKKNYGHLYENKDMWETAL